MTLFSTCVRSPVMQMCHQMLAVLYKAWGLRKSRWGHIQHFYIRNHFQYFVFLTAHQVSLLEKKFRNTLSLSPGCSAGLLKQSPKLGHAALGLGHPRPGVDNLLLDVKVGVVVELKILGHLGAVTRVSRHKKFAFNSLVPRVKKLNIFISGSPNQSPTNNEHTSGASLTLSSDLGKQATHKNNQIAKNTINSSFYFKN